MPEGDTIHRAAATLHKAMAGQVVTRFESMLPDLTRVDHQTPLAGRTIESVTAAGKHLLMNFSGDLCLRTHMRMHGSWHIYRPGERWKRPTSDMRIVIETDQWVAVAFNVPIAEFHDSRSRERQQDLREIGPDLLAETYDAREAMRRIRERPNEEIADVLLNQRVVAGIGNEYKNEILFVARINPFILVRDLDDGQIERILRDARKLMRANVAMRTMQRVTTNSLDPRKAQWVFSRGGKPCRRCGTPIRSQRQGPFARGTWWCPRCQPGQDSGV